MSLGLRVFGLRIQGSGFGLQGVDFARTGSAQGAFMSVDGLEYTPMRS